MTIGWLGLGQMGSRMVPRLASPPNQILVWDRDPQKAQALRGEAITPANCADFSAADVVILMLRDHPATLEVLAGGLLDALRPGTLVIQMATIGKTQALSEAQLLAASGVRYMDAPVAGSTGPAAAGELTILCGGSAEDVEMATPLLQRLGHPHRLGPVGSANAAKVVINHLLGVTVAALAEAYSLGQHLGLGAEPLAELLQGLPTLSPAMRAKLAVMRAQDYSPTFYLELMQKDMALVQASRPDQRLAAAAAELYDEAAEKGHARDDFAAVYAALLS